MLLRKAYRHRVFIVLYRRKMCAGRRLAISGHRRLSPRLTLQCLSQSALSALGQAGSLSVSLSALESGPRANAVSETELSARESTN